MKVLRGGSHFYDEPCAANGAVKIPGSPVAVSDQFGVQMRG